MLNWTITQTENQFIHTTSIADASEMALRKTIEKCTDKAVSLLKNNIQDDSLYLLFEWDTTQATLHIAVTNANKTQDAPDSVCCSFAGLALEPSNTELLLKQTESVKFWLHDYLTTCTAFFNYSLVAIFHSSSRDQTELL
jgi:hypothetical protein